MAGGLLGYALAGAATGAGTGLINEARAKRDAVMEELREQRLMAREDRQFARQSQRDDTQWERQRERDDTQWERQRERDMMTGGELMQSGDRTVNVIGNQVRPLQGPDGEAFDEPLAPRRTSSDTLSRAQISTSLRQVDGDLDEMMMSANDPVEAVASGLDRLQGMDIPEEDRSRWATGALRRAARLERVDDIDRYVKEGRRRLGLDGDDSAGGNRPERSGSSSAESARSGQSANPRPMAAQNQSGPRNPAGEQAGQSIGRAARAAQDARTGMTPEQAIEFARESIEQGADVAAVRSRLRAMGIDPSEAGI